MMSPEEGQIDDNEPEEGEMDSSGDEQDQDQEQDLKIQEESSNPSDPKQDAYNYKEIIALEEKGKNPLETLPNGWIEVRHASGMPLYLHRATRVCTWAKPYELRTGSARKHCIPVSGIPCLAYRRALDKEQNSMNGYSSEASGRKRKHCDFDTGEGLNDAETEDTGSSTLKECEAALNYILDNLASADSSGSEFYDNNSSSNQSSHNGKFKLNHAMLNPNGAKLQAGQAIPRVKCPPENLKNLLPCARVETAHENNTVNSVQPIDFRAYCQKLFKFKHMKCMRFKTWSARRMHNKELKRLHLQRPTVPDGVKLITFSVHNNGDSDGAEANKEYIMNPQGKSSVCILHEYVQHALRVQPTYIFEEHENAATPYLATVQINGVSYAMGCGSSKKQAKAAAAKATLELMIPEMKDDLNVTKDGQSVETDFVQFFDKVSLDDPRITKMCANLSEPSPYALLLTCVQRNFGQSASSSIKFDMVSSGNQHNKFKMETGEYSVEVAAANKREGKQLASQALLAKLHPQIKNFSAFLKMYGNGSIKSVKEKKQEEQQITTLQSKASTNSPNYAILTKLREEMKKLRAEEDGKRNSIEGDVNSSNSSS